ncbi:MAG: triose-phosphate isomerase [Bacteroidetes bacterium]|jgi:triosephosphate isomerase (TIM)|nr:triose-phosphate isomerase [Bacteroidota bacterium]MBT6687652.1 triose-phosphate isomerase [Bacteroidota bacterium]MBT7142847.1 triose-phosphate isomerase [Bacteroidota bacterium]MBT7492579.1 triose-phosphate isomerase [Bacteroidota bacterium]
MRNNTVAGNWKMNNSLKRGIELGAEVNKLVRKNANPDVNVILCTPYIHLTEIANIVDKDIVKIGAQNCSSEPKGAYTGEISARMIKSTGANHVIIGHSERRQYFLENDEILLKKLILTLENDLIPIFCCGELLEQRNAGTHFDIVKKQIEEVLFGLSENDFSKIIIAYEPVWAIGTGVTASSEQAQEMHLFIRNTISEKFGKTIAQNTTILYGGSCKPSNAKELFANADVDGGLIGGASLDANDFLALINSF